MKKYTLIITIKNEQGSTRVKYEGVSRDDLLKDDRTAALVQLHDHSMPDDDTVEDRRIPPEPCATCGGTWRHYILCPAGKRGES